MFVPNRVSLRARLARINLHMLVVAMAFVAAVVLLCTAGMGIHRHVEDGQRHLVSLNQQLAPALQARNHAATGELPTAKPTNKP